MQEYCALPVLYASQWFLTCFSCPFPAKFACRVIDVMLQEQRPHVLLRIALAVVAECEPDILQLDDFEDIITFLKVATVSLLAVDLPDPSIAHVLEEPSTCVAVMRLGHLLCHGAPGNCLQHHCVCHMNLRHSCFGKSSCAALA